MPATRITIVKLRKLPFMTQVGSDPRLFFTIPFLSQTPFSGFMKLHGQVLNLPLRQNTSMAPACRSCLRNDRQLLLTCLTAPYIMYEYS
jgi:hypothetical protein